MLIKKSTSKKLSIILTLVMMFSLLAPAFSFAATSVSHVKYVKVLSYDKDMIVNDSQSIEATGYYKKAGDLDDQVYYRLDVKAPGSSKYVSTDFDEEGVVPEFTPLKTGRYSLKVSAVTSADYERYEGKKYVKTSSIINITVTSLTVKSITAIDSIEVENGTALEEIGLPETVEINLSNGETDSAEVKWDKGKPTYKATKNGTYTFSGTITTPDGVTNPTNKKASVKVMVVDEVTLKVASIEPIDDIQVANGTALADIGLPETVEIITSDGETDSADVTWNKGTPTYKATKNGTYTFSGTITPPDGVTNPNNKKASVKVEVVDEVSLIVTSVEPIADIEVANGTDLEDIVLPETVEINLSDGDTDSADVEWDGGTPAYDGTEAGTYTFSGTITPPDDVTNPNNKKASVKVVVAAAAAETSVKTVTAVNGTVTVAFNKAVTEVPAGLTVLKDGEAMDLAADKFAVADGKVNVTVPEIAKGLTEQSIVYSVKLGDAAAVAADAVIIPVSDAPAAPAVTADDTANVITGIDATMEYKIGDGEWTKYDAAAVPDLSGDKTVLVRVAATDSVPASENVTLTFTTNVVVLIVDSVNVVNATTIEATLTAEQAVVPTADKFTVKIGTEDVAVTGVALKAGTTKTYILTVNMDGKDGVVAVNDKSASAASDYKKPLVTSVQVIDSKQLRINFSEKVNSATFPAATSFKLLNRSNNAVDTFTAASTLVVEEDGTSAILTIGETDNNSFKNILVDFDTASNANVLELIDGNYRLYVNDVKDVAGNFIIVNTLADFTIMPSDLADKTAPIMIPCTYNTASGVLEIPFSEAVKTGIDFDVTKLSITAGTELVASLSALDIPTFSNGNKKVTIQLTATNITSVRTAINAGKVIKVSAAAGAYKDVANNANAAAATSITVSAPPVLTAAEYNEESDILTLTFDKAVVPSTITAAKLIAASVTFEGGTTQSLTGATVISTTDPKVVRVYVPGLTEVNNDITPAHTVLLPVDFVYTTADATTQVGSAATTVINNALTYTEVTGAPILTGATFNNSTKKLELTFDKYITTGDVSIDEPKIDIVKNAGVTTGTDLETLVYSINADGNLATVSGNKVTITLADATVGALTTTVTGLINAVNDGIALSIKLEASAVKGANGSYSIATTSTAATTVQPYVAITATDATKPTASASVISSKIIRVDFNEKVNVVDGANKDNYSVALTADANAILPISNVQLDSTGKIATITLTQAQQVGASYTLKVSGIKDSAGNLMDAYTSTALTGSVATANPKLVDPTAHTIAVVDADNSQNLSNNDYIILNFESPVKLTDGTAQVSSISDSAKLASAFAISGVEADILNGAILSAVSGDETKLKLTLLKTTAGLGWNAVTLGATTINIAATNYIVSTIDGSNATAAANAQTIVAPVATGPKLISAVYADTNSNGEQDKGDKIVVNFDQNIVVPDPSSQPTALDNNFGALVAGAAYKAAKTGDQAVTVTFDAKPTIVFGTTTMDITSVVANVYIVSSWSNKAVKHAGDAADPAVKITTTDTVSPTLTAAAFNDTDNNGVDMGDQIILTFSEAITVGTVTTVDLATSGIAFAGAPTFSKSPFDSKQLIITLASGTNTIAANATIDVRGFGTSNVTDAAGNKAMNLATPLTLANVSVTDNTAPTVSNMTITSTDGTITAAVAGTAITVTIPNTYTASFTTGTATLSEDVSVTIDAIQNQYDLTTPIGVTTTANIANLILTWFTDSGATGVSVATLKANSGSSVTITDKAGNVTTYTLTVN